jgi:hypothetical protein
VDVQPYLLLESQDALPDDEQLRNCIEPLERKYVVQGREDALNKVRPHLETVQALYPKVMERALDLGMNLGQPLEQGGPARAWENRKEFLTCLSKRAKFENRPLDALYLHDIDARVAYVVQSFEATTQSTGNEALHRTPEGRQLCESLGRIVDNVVANSVRNVDALLFDSPIFSDLDSGEPSGQRTFILQRATLEHGTCYLEADLQGRRTLNIEIPIEKLPALNEASPVNLTRTDQSFEEVQTTRAIGPSRFMEGGQVLRVSFAVSPYDYEELRGLLQVGDSRLSFGGWGNQYWFAVPDRAELEKILAVHDIPTGRQ